MHIRVFTTPQLCHVAQALYKYWDNSRAIFWARSLQIMGQLRTGDTQEFRGYVEDLVCSSSFLFELFWCWPFTFQREMQTVFESTKEFEFGVSFTDTDVSLIQECVALATEHPDLAEH